MNVMGKSDIGLCQLPDKRNRRPSHQDERVARIVDGVDAVRAISFIMGERESEVAYTVLAKNGYGEDELRAVRDFVWRRHGQPLSEPEFLMVLDITRGLREEQSKQ